MTPEEKLELLKILIERGVEVRTRYRSRRVVEVWREDARVVLRFEDGDVVEMHIKDFARRRFVAVI